MIWKTAQTLLPCLKVVTNGLVAATTDADQYRLSTAHWHLDS
ncbi:hypothetical protein sync_1155 [Synechococcus sp. CC9311]|nr:hypothetical protein sync_1155 [Synechococcus sp. CC9311]